MTDRNTKTQSPVERFSSRARIYHEHRPSYPKEVIDALARERRLREGSVIADVGSGTGILSKLFLDCGCKVYAVEPNAEMRKVAEGMFENESKFISVEGSAENSSLPDNSVDLVTAGQAFHWFDAKSAKTEFSRILRHDGSVALVWNDRRDDSTAFLKEYDGLLRKFGTDYNEVNPKNVANDPEVFDAFFGKGGYKNAAFYNFQDFDFNGLLGRLRSSSYTPTEGEDNWDCMIEGLKMIFDKHNVDGKVRFEYDTRLYFGRIPR